MQYHKYVCSQKLNLYTISSPPKKNHQHKKLRLLLSGNVWVPKAEGLSIKGCLVLGEEILSMQKPLLCFSSLKRKLQVKLDDYQYSTIHTCTHHPLKGSHVITHRTMIRVGAKKRSRAVFEFL